jgi:hypothetical protein
MAKKPKNFETPLDFFDVAIAAPSMEAALEAWGADNDLFQGVPQRRTTFPRSARLAAGRSCGYWAGTRKPVSTSALTPAPEERIVLIVTALSLALIGNENAVCAPASPTGEKRHVASNELVRASQLAPARKAAPFVSSVG